jgi:uncharacterized protein YbjT (DUF2867 family)
MKTSKTIAIIGATGRLALPVIHELILQGFQVQAIVRDLEKAKKVLPPAVILTKGEVSNIPSLVKGLKGADFVYINLSSDEVNPNQSFYTEREGIKNIVEACQLTGIQQILKISALGAYPSAKYAKEILQNQIRRQGHQFIEQSHIPFTIFHPTWFLDTIFWAIKKDTLQWIGKPVGFYWTNSADYAKQVVAAIGNPVAYNKHYAVQGAEKLDYHQVFEKLKVSSYPNLKLQVMPLWLVQFLGIFMPKMKHLAQLFGFYEQINEQFYAQNTWDDLGKPVKTSQVSHKNLTVFENL